MVDSHQKNERLAVRNAVGASFGAMGSQARFSMLYFRKANGTSGQPYSAEFR